MSMFIKPQLKRCFATCCVPSAPDRVRLTLSDGTDLLGCNGILRLTVTLRSTVKCSAVRHDFDVMYYVFFFCCCCYNKHFFFYRITSKAYDRINKLTGTCLEFKSQCNTERSCRKNKWNSEVVHTNQPCEEDESAYVTRLYEKICTQRNIVYSVLLHVLSNKTLEVKCSGRIYIKALRLRVGH